MDNILIIYHHKTGCVLSKTIFEIYKNLLKDKIDISNNKIIEENIIKKNKLIKNFKINFKLTSKYNLYYQASPCYIYNIPDNLKFTKIIHFIRDPYEQSISNFNYHLLEPTPENWFLNIDNDINNWFSNTKLLKLLFKILELDYDIIEFCKKYLKKIYKPKKGKTYYKNLLKLREEDKENAIIIETLRFIFETKHILKMACIIKLNINNNNNFLYLQINDFKNDNIDKTISKINKFMFKKENINSKKIIKRYKKKYDSMKNGVHISNNTKEEKEELKHILYNNIYIRLIFNKVTKIINNYI